MPRFEKKGRSKRELFEICRHEASLFVAAGTRQGDTDEWQFRERDRFRTKLSDEAAAIADQEARIAKVVEKGFALVGEVTPHAGEMMYRYLVERAAFEEDPSLLPPPAAAIRARFAAAKQLGGVTAEGERLDVVLDGENLEIRRDGSSDTEYFPTPDEAIDEGTVLLWVAQDLLGYTLDA